MESPCPTSKKVTKTLSAIKKAVTLWSSSKVKPESLRNRILKLKSFHDDLSRWEKKFNKVKSSAAGRNQRILIMREFIEICYAHGNA